jgi:hypothetical protein
MKFRLVCCLSMFVTLAASCGGGGNNPDGGGMITQPVGNVVMRDQNSYTSVSSLTIPTVQTASGADLQVCWGDIMKDILCHDVSVASDINNVSFLQIPGLSKDAIREKLAKGTLTQNEVAVYREFHTTASSTCATLSQFAFGSQLVPATDYVTAANKSYMLLFSTGTTPGSGAKTMLFLDPVASSTNMMVAAPASSCDILSFQANLTTPMPLSIPMNGDWVVDWSQITKDSMGNKVTFQLIDSLMLGYYEGKTVTQLEDMFKDIDMIATTLWEVAIPTGQKHMDLKNAKTSAGVAFSGFTGNGIYAVALLCSSCQVPAPVAMSILAPAP